MLLLYTFISRNFWAGPVGKIMTWKLHKLVLAVRLHHVWQKESGILTPASGTNCNHSCLGVEEEPWWIIILIVISTIEIYSHQIHRNCSFCSLHQQSECSLVWTNHLVTYKAMVMLQCNVNVCICYFSLSNLSHAGGIILELQFLSIQFIIWTELTPPSKSIHLRDRMCHDVCDLSPYNVLLLHTVTRRHSYLLFKAYARSLQVTAASHRHFYKAWPWFVKNVNCAQ